MIKFLLFKENRNFFKWWLAQIISNLGDRIHQLALVGLIAERAPGSTMSLAKVFLFTILPVFLIQPIAGVWVDRWNRKKTLITCDLARAFLVLGIPLIFMSYSSMIPIYIIVFAVFTFSRFYIPAKMSFIPDLVRKEDLIEANSLVATTGMIAVVVGCAIGGFLIDYGGAKSGFIFDAFTFLVSALLLLSIKILPKPRTANIPSFIQLEKTVWQEIKEGFVYLMKHTEIRFVINMLFIALMAAGAVYVVLIIFIQKSFNSITRDLGILAIGLAVGLFLGAVGYGKWGKKFAPSKTIFACLTAGGLVLTIFALIVYFDPNFLAAMALSVIIGIVIGPIFIAANSIVHAVSDEKMRGKVFSALEVVIHFAFLAAMLVSAWLSEFIAEVWILTGVGVIVFFLGSIGFIRYRERKII